MKNKSTLIWVGVAVVIVALLWWGGGANQSSAGTWQDTEVACLPGGHQNAAMHIHANLNVFVDGERQTIPANVGINANCMAEVHTHDASGELHVESVNANQVLTIGDFFAVWDRPLEREGYQLEATVDGEPMEDITDHQVRDGQEVVLNYTSSTESSDDNSGASAPSAPSVPASPPTPGP